MKLFENFSDKNTEYEFFIKGYDVTVAEDTYEGGEGKVVNEYYNDVNKTFDSAEEMFKYINDNIIYSEEKFTLFEGRLETDLLVDKDQSPASESEIEEWEKGEKELFSARYSFFVKIIIKKEFSDDEMASILGVEKY